MKESNNNRNRILINVKIVKSEIFNKLNNIDETSIKYQKEKINIKNPNILKINNLKSKSNLKMPNNMIFLLLIIIYAQIYTSKINKKIRNLNFDWEIYLKIKGVGEQSILSDQRDGNMSFKSLPNIILANGNWQNVDYKIYDLTEEINNITLIWDHQITNCNLMFSGLSNIIEIDLSNFDSSGVTNMLKMFKDCISLTSINLNNFNTEQVRDMRDLFYNCSSLTSLDLKSFNTSKVSKMHQMFSGCLSLTSLNLSHFSTSLVDDMQKMFKDCKRLQYLDISNFDTSSVSNMDRMFASCRELISLDLKSFETSGVKKMEQMFYNCKKIQSLDLSNFDTKKISSMSSMFNGCSSLISLDLNNFDTSSVTNMNQMFKNCKSLISLKIDNFKTSKVKTMFSMFTNCSSLMSLNLYNFDTSSTKNFTYMFTNSSINIIFCINEANIPNIVKQLQEVSNKSYINICSDNFENLTDYIEKIKLISLSNNIETESFENPTDFNENKGFTNFSDNIETENFENPTDFNENKDFVNFSHNIKTENFENPTDFNENFVNFSNNIETENFENPTDFNENFVNFSNNIEIDNYENNNSKDIFSNENDLKCTPFKFLKKNCRIENSEKEAEEMIENIRIELLKDSLNPLIYNLFNNDKKDLLVEDNDIIYQITSLYNQKYKEYYNISTIKLGECESKLKEKYNISKNDSILIFKLDFISNSSLYPVTEYEIYDYETKQKLELNVCDNIKIELDYLLPINENELFKYNLSSDYYNDNCFPYTTEKETDIILTDRKNEYYQKNMSLCQETCQFTGYNNEDKKVKCECNIKKNFTFFSKIILDNSTFKEMLDITNAVNLYVLKCYKYFLKKDGLIENLGSYIILSIIFINIILLFIFIIKGYKLLLKKIDGLINIKTKKSTKINIKKNQKKKCKTIIKNRKLVKTGKIFKNKKNKRIETTKNNPPKNKKNKNISMNGSRTNNYLDYIDRKSNRTLQLKKTFNTTKSVKSKIKLKYNDYEINNLTYNKALKIDKRTYSQYYLSLLRRKQILLFTFYTSDDYNSKIIKLSLLLFNFSLSLVINALFFGDLAIHKIYIEEGAFKFLNQLPQILYSTVISTAINSLISFLSLSEKNILKIKDENKKKGQNKSKEIFLKVTKCLRIKFTFYFLLNFLLLVSFWYYLGCFCVVYKNTQLHLIKDTLISFLLSLIYPLGLNLLPGIIRIPSLKSKKQDKECLYKFSLWVQILI